MTGSRFREIADDLRERIALGDVGGSGALDSEAVLGERYGASRMTVRRALELVRDDGLVESRQGAGWFVRGGTFHQRLALGTFRHADSAVTQAGRELNRAVIAFAWEAAPGGVAAALAVPAGAEILHVRSVRSVDGEPLDTADEWVPAEVGGSISRADAADPGIWHTLARQGREIGTVRQSITAGVAGPADGVLRVAAGTPLLLVRRVARDAGERAVALSDHRYLAARFSLEVEFNGWSAGTGDAPPGLREANPSAEPSTTE